MKAEAGRVVEAQPAHPGGSTVHAGRPDQLRAADQRAPVVLFIRHPCSTALLRAAVVVQDDGLMQAHTVAEFDTAERLFDQPQQPALALGHRPSSPAA